MRDAAGSAAASAPRCRNCRRETFIFRLPLAMRASSVAGPAMPRAETEISQGSGLPGSVCAIVWVAALTPPAFRARPVHMQKSLLFIPGPVAVFEPVLAAMAKPLINHRGPEYARLLHSIADRMQSIFATKGDVLLLGSSGTGSLEAAVTNMFGPGDTVLACPTGV